MMKKWEKMSEEQREKNRISHLWQPARNKWIPMSDKVKEKLKPFLKWGIPRNKWIKKPTNTWRTRFIKWQIAWNKGIPNLNIRWDKCHLWRWWTTPELLQVRHSLEIKIRRRWCFDRDNYTCQKCWKHWWDLEVHHIHNFSSNKELRTSIENWITLCKICHRWFHNIYWRQNNTKEQLLNFYNIII